MTKKFSRPVIERFTDFLSKRLERGTFSWPKPGQSDGPKLKLTPEAFAMLTDGVDLRGAKLRPWYERE